MLVELLAAEGEVAGDSNDHTDFLLLLLSGMPDLFGHSDGVILSMVSTFHIGKWWACTFATSRGRFI